MRLIDPGVQQDDSVSSKGCAPRLGSLEGLKIGLLTNGKHNADVLLKETAALFAHEHGCEVVQFADKQHAGKPASPELIRELADQADFLITAMGD